MSNFKINQEVTFNAALLILEMMGGKCGIHKLFKILYFADQKHLARYGTPISGDVYIKMDKGPVPSALYDFVKHLRGARSENASELFDMIDDKTLAAKSKPDFDELAESYIECLEQSFEENAHLPFGELTLKSHDSAWNSAKRKIDPIEIARVGGADNEMLKYIEINLENESIFH